MKIIPNLVNARPRQRVSSFAFSMKKALGIRARQPASGFKVRYAVAYPPAGLLPCPQQEKGAWHTRL
jgi:hypothetical protein